MTLQIIKPYISWFGFWVDLCIGFRVGRFIGCLDAWLSKEEKGKGRQTKKIPNQEQNKEEEEETWHSKKIRVAWYWNLRNEMRCISEYLQEPTTRCMAQLVSFF